MMEGRVAVDRELDAVLAERYDVVVVGAGSAGAAVAARLTEDEGRRVLLLEAGPDYRSADTPAVMRSTNPVAVMDTEAIVRDHTYPLLVATRTPEQGPLPYLRGRGVGGSSQVNGMFAIRATVEDLDGWAAAGCPGWGYDDVLPLLNRMERDLDFGHEPFHGDAGPIPVLRPRPETFTPVEAAICEAAPRLGQPWAPDHSAPGSTGVSPYAYSSDGTGRVSTNDAYLEPARGRAGLQVLGGAVVDRVLVEAGRTVGVRVVVGRRTADVRAGEVVVSAGAIHTPAVLLRSGIGPVAELRRHGIAPVADLPVGVGLQDHAGFDVSVELAEGLAYEAAPARPGNICIRFDTGVGDERNDGMIAILSALGFGVPIAGAAVFVNRAASTGSVRLASTDPTADPAVELGLLSHPDDLARLVAAVDLLRAVTAEPEVRAVCPGASIAGTPLDRLPTGADFEAFALQHVSDTVHASASCRMGSPEDPTTVVDADGRVHGVAGLRLADTSVLPWVPRANTNLTAILVGEVVADRMRGGGPGGGSA